MGALSNKVTGGRADFIDDEPIATAQEAAAAMAQVLADISLLSEQMKIKRAEQAAPRLFEGENPADELVFEDEEPDELVFEADVEEDGVRARLVKLGEDKAAELKPIREVAYPEKYTQLQTADEIDELTLMNFGASSLDAVAPTLVEDLGSFNGPASLDLPAATLADDGGRPIVEEAEAGALQDLMVKRKRDRN